VLAGAPAGPLGAQEPPAAGTRPADSTFFFVRGLGYGTDLYGGPFDVILNKGFAVAQWRGQDRHIFSYPYAWRAIWSSVKNPGPAMKKAGGWGKVLRRHMLPFGGDEIREGQWVPNYFGHVFEGGLSYRRLLEWNRVNGVPFATLTTVLTTQFAVALNEAYETPRDDPWVRANGTAGLFMDFAVFDPVGMLLFHHDGVARFFARKLGTSLWPRQASITLPDGQVANNGQAIVFRPRLWFTDAFRLFLRAGVGVEGGVSIPRDDGLEVSLGLGAQSYSRTLDPESQVESAKFGLSAGVWVDREGSLLFSATWDEKTDRRLAIDLFPGVVSPGGLKIGAWFLIDADGRPYFGLTGGRTLGVGLGVGF
jgi:hypothetical protein